MLAGAARGAHQAWSLGGGGAVGRSCAWWLLGNLHLSGVSGRWNPSWPADLGVVLSSLAAPPSAGMCGCVTRA